MYISFKEYDVRLFFTDSLVMYDKLVMAKNLLLDFFQIDPKSDDKWTKEHLKLAKAVFLFMNANKDPKQLWICN